MKRAAVLVAITLAVAALAYVTLYPEADDTPGSTLRNISGVRTNFTAPGEVPEIPDGGSLASPPDKARIPPYPYEIPAWKREMLETLERTEFALDVRGASLVDFLAVLGRVLPYPIDSDPGADLERKVGFSLQTKKTTAAHALRVLEVRSGLAIYYTDGRIHLAAPDLVPPLEGAEAVLAGLDRARKILEGGGPIRPRLDSILPVRFETKAIWEVCAELSMRLGVRYMAAASNLIIPLLQAAEEEGGSDDE